MIQAYRKHTNERKEKGIPPLPLTPSQAQKLCQLLENPSAGEEKYLLQHCPFLHGWKPCGIWCPLFEEPRTYRMEGKIFWNLALCEKVLVFEDFIDERGEKIERVAPKMELDETE